MKLWLLIPVKPFAESKTRLAGVLDACERVALSRQLLENTLTLAHQSGHFHAILVISRDPGVRALAERAGATTLTELNPHPSDPLRTPYPLPHARTPLDAPATLLTERTLNHALELGREHASAGGADALLVLPADLPLLELSDLDALLAAVQNLGKGPGVVIAPSHDGGTNALLLRPPHAIPFAFGVQSLARHHALAEQAGCAVKLLRTPSLMYDLDLPEDLWGEDLGL